MRSLVVLRSGRTTGLGAEADPSWADALAPTAADEAPPLGVGSQPEQAGRAIEAKRQNATRSEWAMG